MRFRSSFLAALALAVVVPAVAEAQVNVVVARRGMLGFASEQHITQDGQLRRVVVDVVAGSPAEKAGVMVGDTVLRFNGLQPGSELLTAFAPGDTVTLRLRRNGSERDVRIVAAERPVQTFERTFGTLPDTIRRTVALMVDGMRASMDTVHFPRLHIERVGPDSAVIIFGNERLLLPSMRGEVHLDSIRTMMMTRPGGSFRIFSDSAGFTVHADSILARVGGVFRSQLGDTTVFRLHQLADSAFIRMRGTFNDSAFGIFRGEPGSRVISFGDGRPGEVFTNTFSLGMRAVAGAELTELNPALGEFFGALEGVLVLNAPEGTPAARAGLRAGDVIVRANGEAVTSIPTLRRAIDRAGAGRPVSLDVLRKGSRVSIQLGRE